ncbi:hypothetical protein LCGC14_0814760 [marine sediment metagenome]|uniref:Uncharacterized protein n=1 Tax=marine sediment metagenome TaxID=412755 RepID=A0A0F9Q5W8_9ZZZZ
MIDCFRCAFCKRNGDKQLHIKKNAVYCDCPKFFDAEDYTKHCRVSTHTSCIYWTDSITGEKKGDDMSKLLAYDDPHPSGGNCHVIMTEKQAIEWVKKIYKENEGVVLTDKQALDEFIAVNFAYWEEDSRYREGYVKGAADYGGIIVHPENVRIPERK